MRSKLRNKSEWDVELTGHLSSLQVPEVLHCHLQDVCLLQFGVSGALRGRKAHLVSVTRTVFPWLTQTVWTFINIHEDG